MQIPYSYLEDEVRDGFYVDSLMKCSWAAQLQVLEKIDEICQKHHIQYQAEWGTLLGTVRHRGFIPWDDDMDISMKRKDYNKFIEVVQKELPEGYSLINYATQEKYWDVISRVVNTMGIHFDNGYLNKHCYFPFPAGIDIFPLDYLPKDKEEFEIIKDLIRDIRGVADLYTEGELDEEQFELYLERFETECNRKIPRDEKVVERLYDIVTELSAVCHEEKAEDIAFMHVWVEYGKGSFPKEYYSKVSRLPFECTTMPVPVVYDSILKNKYGNYMKMVRKGGAHDYPLYKKSIDLMEEKGAKWERYEYSKREVRQEKAEKLIWGEDNLQLLEKIHLTLYKMLIAGAVENVLQLLEKCQDCAVSFGEKIEIVTGEAREIITALEEYCELIYQIYQLLNEGEVLNAEGMYEILQEQLRVIYNVYEKEYKQKKKIVFIIDKASRWESLESVWRAAKEEESNNVSVIVVPYCYKRYDNSIIEEHYEAELFPDYVDIVDYKTIDIEQYHPNIIYINSPYDEYNYFTSIHQNFYSSKLVHCCDELVYIPWFMITELTREDERGWQSMQHFVTMPGVVNADRVIVQSEQMKQSYVDYLTDWAGEDTRQLWEEKIRGLGSPLMDLKDDKIDIEKNLPESWKAYLYKANGEAKKVILYHMSSASFIDYKEKAVDKLKRVLEVFKENKEDICLLWYWDATMEETLRKEYPKYWEEFKGIAEKYKEEAWGIYDEQTDKEFMIRVSDAYYGDGSAISQMMVVAEKPVMLQNFEC